MDPVDDVAPGAAERRDALARRACRAMGWPFRAVPVWEALRGVSSARAVAVNLEKFQELLDEVDKLRRLNASLCERCAANSEILTRRAECQRSDAAPGAGDAGGAIT